MARHWQNGQQIEVQKRGSRGGVGGPGSIMLHHEADFIFDMTTFKVLKNRHGTHELTPLEGCLLLGELLNDPHSRILLLTD